MLNDDLKFLKLTSILSSYEDKIRDAEKNNLSYHDFLKLLIEDEVRTKIEKSIQRKIKQAKFDRIKTIDTFDFNWPTSMPIKKIKSFLDLKFIERKENIIFIGDTSLGKSHLAKAIGYLAALSRISTRYTKAIDMVNDLHASNSDGTFAKKMKAYIRPALLIIDELNFLPLDKKGGDYLFQVIDKRYEAGSIILTTNLLFREWNKIFEDNTKTNAAIERLAHHGEPIVIKGESYRLKDKKKKKIIDDLKKEEKKKKKK